MQSGGRWILGAWWSALAETAQHQVLLAKFWGGLRMTITLKQARNLPEERKNNPTVIHMLFALFQAAPSWSFFNMNYPQITRTFCLSSKRPLL